MINEAFVGRFRASERRGFEAKAVHCYLIVPTLCVGMQRETLCVIL
jgi:hypothetical protein